MSRGIGRACNVALASLPNFTLPGVVSPSVRYWGSDIVPTERTVDPASMVAVPTDRPGLGVIMDTDHVGDLTVWTETLRRP